MFCFFVFVLSQKLSFLPVKQVGQNLRLAEFLENFDLLPQLPFHFFLSPIGIIFFRLLKAAEAWVH